MTSPGVEKRYGSWEEAVSWLIAQPEQAEFVRACYFDAPRLAAAERFRSSEEWSAARELLPKSPGRALDVGAGNGIVSYALAKDGWDVIAVEPDPSMLVGSGAIRELAREGRVCIEVVEQTGEHLGLPDAGFDLVYARQVLHHAADLPAFCRELFRVLKPGGTLLASREHVISSARQLPAFLERHPLQRLYGGENAFTARFYYECLNNAGFELARVIRPFDSPLNYAPQTLDSLRREIQRRAGRVPLGKLFTLPLYSDVVMAGALRVMSLLDRRPGRNFSFVARKPEVRR